MLPRKKKLIHRSFWISLPAYKWDVEVVATNDVDGYAKKRGHFDEKPCEAYQFANVTDRESVLVFPNSVSYGVISHEVAHCIIAVLRDVEAWSEENFTYHLEYLVDEIISEWTRRIKKKTTAKKARK